MALRKAMPEGQVRLHRSGLEWDGEITPTALSQTYRLHIKYRPGKGPEVTVTEPTLRTRGNEPLPHTFPGERLCLNYPSEWHPAMLISRTVLPWASEWLAHYEIWLATGIWTGGGHEVAWGPASDDYPFPLAADIGRTCRSPLSGSWG